jgi:hypothetical protein
MIVSSVDDQFDGNQFDDGLIDVPGSRKVASFFELFLSIARYLNDKKGRRRLG